MSDNGENNLKITREDLQEIYGEDWKSFQETILDNCYCGNCKGSHATTIVDYVIYINELNDVILRGKCKTCGSPVGNYAETGENEKYVHSIEKVRRSYEFN